MTNTCIAVDAMGGEHAPDSIVEGLRILGNSVPARFLLVGDEERIRACGLQGLNVETIHAEQVVDMNESPSIALKKKRSSSIAKAVDLIKQGKAQAFFSAGNTGVAMAFALFELGRLEGVFRPALASLIPTVTQPTVLVDVGANVDCKPLWLVQFAVMGQAFVESVLRRDNPSVGLLSIGEEQEKGNDLTLQTYRLLEKACDRFLGNVEGQDITSGKSDVVVADGFVGNVLLKFGEGLAELIIDTLKEELGELQQRVDISAAKDDPLAKFMRQMDYAEYGAALLLGVKGNCLIGHGKSSPKAVANALKQAYRSAYYVLNERIVEKIKECDDKIACDESLS